MDGDIDVYKHFAWLKRVSDWLLWSEWVSREIRAREMLGGGRAGVVFVQQSPVVAKFSMRI